MKISQEETLHGIMLKIEILDAELETIKYDDLHRFVEKVTEADNFVVEEALPALYYEMVRRVLGRQPRDMTIEVELGGLWCDSEE